MLCSFAANREDGENRLFIINLSNRRNKFQRRLDCRQRYLTAIRSIAHNLFQMVPSTIFLGVFANNEHIQIIETGFAEYIKASHRMGSAPICLNILAWIALKRDLSNNTSFNPALFSLDCCNRNLFCIAHFTHASSQIFGRISFDTNTVRCRSLQYQLLLATPVIQLLYTTYRIPVSAL